MPKDAVWSIDADYATQQSVAATSDYGTPRANGTRLLELALNMKTPVIYDPDPSDPEKRVVNQEATLAAKEKQRAIKEKFRSWVFADPERTERLVRLYNDTYNNLRPRLFDGSHLDFPGMNQTIRLHPHQKDAIWRIMSSGNTLLAHAVGAGKTYTMAAAGMKMKQAGLTQKPMYVVPNHLLEQFAREFMQLYPNAKLLVAGKDDFTRERRKFLTAKIASGEWDGIVVTHSSFERIGMSRDYQEQFLKEQIAEYDQLLCDGASKNATRAHRNLIKTIEKQKAKREERLKDLLAEDKKDDGLVFDELGVDHIFIDEAHYFKNLETPTKMDRVAGIQTGGSERAFDLYMKSRYLHQLHPGHGVTLRHRHADFQHDGGNVHRCSASSTPRAEKPRHRPFRRLGRHLRRGRGHHGNLARRRVVAAAEPLRPLHEPARTPADVPGVFAMCRRRRCSTCPAPSWRPARPLSSPARCRRSSTPSSRSWSPATTGCAARRSIRARTTPWPSPPTAASSPSTPGCCPATAPDFPGSKVNALVDNVAAVWRKTEATRGTQMIFCDMGVHPTPWGYSAYDEVMRKLVQHGIPRQQIAMIGDADSDAKKLALFEKVRSGSVRVLIGSTQKMGTGTNVQKRLVALHHLDAPWKPAEVEQRDGRILRQKNENKQVAIYRYVTEGSFDAYMWQALETKARFISQVMTGDNALRRAEDIGGQELSYAEVKAIASGNPAVLTLAEADAELQRLNLLKRNHADEQYLARRRLRELPDDHRRAVATPGQAHRRHGNREGARR